jgi:hypothetical protein
VRRDNPAALPNFGREKPNAKMIFVNSSCCPFRFVIPAKMGSQRRQGSTMAALEPHLRREDDHLGSTNFASLG